MGTEAKKFATYSDILALPEHLIGEIINGELIASPRPGPRHTRSSSALGGAIFNPFDRGGDGPGGWWILDEPEIHLSTNVVVPDLAGWRRELIPNLPTAKAYFEIVPQWVCEVLSKKTAVLDRIKKMPIYAQAKVNHFWLVDPEQKTLEVYLREDQRWVLLNSFSGNEIIRAEPFDAIEINLGNLWLPDDTYEEN
ncbi:MAG: Uma2 family endonuclease [Gammaproteobacteria bacterium]